MSEFERKLYVARHGSESRRCRLRDQLPSRFTLFFLCTSSSHPFTGALFTHWIADSLTLWKSAITDEHLWIAASYYSILAKGPVEILYFLSAIVVLGGTTILWSLRDGQAGNILFDGGSICTLLTTIVHTT